MFVFSPKKAVQASAVLLRAHQGRMSRWRLLKMLYMGDRELLTASGVPITGDAVYAMEYGPVLERVYDLIKGKDIAFALWSKFIANAGPQDLILVKEPGVGCLSEFEVDTLEKIAEDHRDLNDWDVVEESHKLQEWIKNEPPKGSRKFIPLHDILEAIGILDMEESIKSETKMESIVNELLARIE